MPKNIRIIPRLDVKGPNVVKGVHLEGLRVVGRPELLARRYYEDGADEIMYIDSVASLYGRNNLEEIVRRAAEQIYIPLIVGGGVRSVEDIRRLLRAGADKVAINTAAVKRPELLAEGARAFGSQCIIVSIQARRRGAGSYECLTDNARETTGLEVLDWAERAVELGAGEVLLTSVDRDGTGEGYDTELVTAVAERVAVPVIACGGAGRKEDVRGAVVEGKADAVAAASIFHYHLLDDMEEAQYPEEGNVDFLRRQLPVADHRRRGIETTSISDLKRYLVASGVPCRTG